MTIFISVTHQNPLYSVNGLYGMGFIPVLREYLFTTQKTSLLKLPLNESLEVLWMDWTMLTILSFDSILVLLWKGL